MLGLRNQMFLSDIIEELQKTQETATKKGLECKFCFLCNEEASWCVQIDMYKLIEKDSSDEKESKTVYAKEVDDLFTNRKEVRKMLEEADDALGQTTFP